MAALEGLPDGRVFLAGDDGLWHHIPDPDTFNALGLDWNAISWVGELDGSEGDELGAIAGQPPSPPATNPPPSPTADNAAGASSFVWGGRSWSGGDQAAFIGYLAAHGTDYSAWANNHPAAAAIFDQPSYPGGTEPVPKSLGQALAAYISGGSTPEEAARQTEALRASLVAQGVSGVTPAQLLQDAHVIAQTYADAGGPPDAPPPQGNGDGGGNDSGIATYLEGDAIILDMADDFPSRELQGVTELPAKAWQDLRDQLVKDMPYVGTHVRARGKQLGGVVASDLWSSSS